MGGRSSKIKGARIEREIVQRFKDAGLRAQRIDARLGQFGADKSHDVDVYRPGRDAPFCGEVKGRKQFPAWLIEWLGENDFLVLREDRRDPVYVLPERIFIELMGK